MKQLILVFLLSIAWGAMQCPDLTCAFNFFNGSCFIHSGDSPVTEIKLYSCLDDEICNIEEGKYAWTDTVL